MKFVDDSQNLRVRLRVIQALVLLLLGVLCVRLYLLQIVNGSRYAEIAENQRIRLLPIPAPRGAILDRNGNQLVDSRPIYSVILSREITKSIDYSLITPLSDGLQLDSEILRERFDQVKSQPAFESILIKEGVTSADIGWVDAHQLEFPTLRIEQTPQRRYPENGLLCHVLGYVGEISPEQLRQPEYRERGYKPGDIVGREGLESVYDEYLRGRDGYRKVIVDSRGHIQNEVERVEPQSGQDIVITIDLDLRRNVGEHKPGSLWHWHFSHGLTDQSAQVGGAKGALLVSQISVGEENNLAIRVYGETGGLDGSRKGRAQRRPIPGPRGAPIPTRTNRASGLFHRTERCRIWLRRARRTGSQRRHRSPRPRLARLLDLLVGGRDRVGRSDGDHALREIQQAADARSAAVARRGEERRVLAGSVLGRGLVEVRVDPQARAARTSPDARLPCRCEDAQPAIRTPEEVGDGDARHRGDANCDPEPTVAAVLAGEQLARRRHERADVDRARGKKPAVDDRAVDAVRLVLDLGLLPARVRRACALIGEDRPAQRRVHTAEPSAQPSYLRIRPARLEASDSARGLWRLDDDESRDGRCG